MTALRATERISSSPAWADLILWDRVSSFVMIFLSAEKQLYKEFRVKTSP